MSFESGRNIFNEQQQQHGDGTSRVSEETGQPFSRAQMPCTGALKKTLIALQQITFFSNCNLSELTVRQIFHLALSRLPEDVARMGLLMSCSPRVECPLDGQLSRVGDHRRFSYAARLLFECARLYPNESSSYSLLCRALFRLTELHSSAVSAPVPSRLAADLIALTVVEVPDELHRDLDELDRLLRVTVVDAEGRSLYDCCVLTERLLKDGPATYKQLFFSGFAKSLNVVHEEVAQVVWSKHLVGYKLREDLRALTLSHPWELRHDLLKLFNKGSPERSLSDLSVELLQLPMTYGGRDSLENSRTAMQLYLKFGQFYEEKNRCDDLGNGLLPLPKSPIVFHDPQPVRPVSWFDPTTNPFVSSQLEPSSPIPLESSFSNTSVGVEQPVLTAAPDGPSRPDQTVLAETRQVRQLASQVAENFSELLEMASSKLDNTANDVDSSASVICIENFYSRPSASQLHALCSLYGRVVEIQTQPLVAHVRFSSAEESCVAQDNLDNVQLFNRYLKVTRRLRLPPGPKVVSFPENQLRPPNSWRACRPSAVLVISNLPTGIDVCQLFRKNGFAVSNFRVYSMEKRALCQLENVDLAVQALMKLHGQLKISFSHNLSRIHEWL